MHLASTHPDQVIAVHSVSGEVTTFTSAGEIVSRSSCSCAVTGIVPMGRAGYFHLQTDGSEGPLWILAARTAAPEVYFVPRGVLEPSPMTP